MINIKIIEWETLINEYAKDWYFLVKNTGINFSLTPGWLNISRSTKSRNNSIRAVVALQDGELVAVLPFFFQRVKHYKIPMNSVSIISNLFSYHAAIPSIIETEKLIDYLLIEAGVQWDVFTCLNIEKDTDSYDSIINWAKKEERVLFEMTGERSPYIALAEESFEEFLSHRSKKFRYNRKREVRMLYETSCAENIWYENDANADELMNHILHIERNSWKVEKNMSISQRDFEENYYRRLIPYLQDENSLLANIIFIEDKPVAYNLCYSWNNKIGQMKTSFDNNFRKQSAGGVVLFHLIEKAYQLKVKELDFLGDAMEHKLKWTDQIRNHENVFIFNKNIKANVIGKLKNYVSGRRMKS